LSPEKRVAGSSGDDLEETLAATAPVGTTASRLNPHRWLRWESGLIVLLIGVVIFGIVVSPEFLSSYNLFSLGLSNGEIAIMVLPMALIIMTGEIDLSVAANLGLSSSMVGYLWSHGWPMPGIIVTVLALGLVLGAFNGVLVTRLGLPSLAVTIGTRILYGGIAEIILGSNIISNFPSSYTNIGVNAVPHTDLSFSALLFLILALVVAVVLHATPVGRSIFAIGANKEAALYAGIRVKRIKTGLFMLSGVMCALAGVLYTFRLSTAEYDNGTGLELPVVAIVLFGGVSIFGGKGTMGGVVLAVLVFCGIQNVLLLTNFNQEGVGVVTGGLLLLSVLAPNVAELRSRWVHNFERLRRRSLADTEPGP
jgi:rhamnose transport system permease protein